MSYDVLRHVTIIKTHSATKVTKTNTPTLTITHKRSDVVTSTSVIFL
jgi:hypothetical protein